MGLLVKSSATATGIACGVGAGALWGLVFLAPALGHAFSPLQLTVGRYLAYGAISLLLILPRWRRLMKKSTTQLWLVLAWLALTGNTLYYILLSCAVQFGGIALTSLIIGFLPVAVTIIGSGDKDAVPLGKLVPSLVFCGIGAVCIGWQAVANSSVNAISPPFIGICCGLGALASWTTYAVSNSRWLSRFNTVSIHDWNLLLGIATGLQAILLLLFAYVFQSESSGDILWEHLIGISLSIAVLCSFAGNALWNKMSRLLPLTMVGQMILFETLFALVYGFLWEWRLPTVSEALAFAFVSMSVISCVAAHRTPITINKAE